MRSRLKNVYEREGLHLMETGAKRSGANRRTSPATGSGLESRPGARAPRLPRTCHRRPAQPRARRPLSAHLIQTKRVLRVVLVTHTSALH